MSSYIRRELAVKLSKRQREILRHLAYGNTCRDVAGKLGIAVKTVDAHKTNIMKKLGIHNRVDLVRAALVSGLIDFDHWIKQLEREDDAKKAEQVDLADRETHASSPTVGTESRGA